MLAVDQGEVQLVLDSTGFLQRLVQLLHHTEERVVFPVVSIMVSISSGTSTQIEALFTEEAVKALLRVLNAGIEWTNCKEEVAEAISNITYCTLIFNF